MLFPFLPLLVRAATALVPGDDKEAPKLSQFLDENLLAVASIALLQAARKVIRTGWPPTWASGAGKPCSGATRPRSAVSRRRSADGLVQPNHTAHLHARN